MENIETLLAAVAQTQGFADDPVAAPAPAQSQKVENSDSRPGNSDGINPTGEVPGNAQPLAVAAAPPLPPVAAISAAQQVIGAGEKRKRGRPPKGQLAAAKPPPPKRKKLEEEEEEDVCFICFDGGSLVLCDRKGCPKAYHPACIKRDEAFFKSKAKWNCGWHICSVCRKASHYMCYTCTYSLCKGCTKNTDYVCLRGNKGFCATCMKTIMLIENKDPTNNEVQVDFDDKLSWEYLFKVYWVILKEKLSLTLSELTHAKPPWKGVPAVAWKPQLNNVPHAAGNGKVSNSSMKTEHLELNIPCAESNSLQNDGIRTAPSSIDNCVDKLNYGGGEGGPSHNNDSAKPNVGDVTDDPGIKKDDQRRTVEDNKQHICKNTDNTESDKSGTKVSTEWASKDLLELVAFLRNGDMSAMSPFDVQTLLLDYIKRNNLRDPRQKSQIICDQRLKNLFGKPRVGHIEMLKLLEFHFPLKEDFQNNNLIPAGFVASDVVVEGNINNLPTSVNSRKRKSRKKNEERVPQNNLNEYAAIDVHNINLIYLRRNLMENLLQDQVNFKNKVIGSIVRIRTSSNEQKQDIYRLVQVVGTIKVAEPYKIGERTENVMLEVLNLYKKEVVSIDAISNQEFTEDECRRLRQSMRCGLVRLLIVGELQRIALALKPMKIKDWLDAEILRLNHLRDRASENGRKKELREYVDRLELLKSPEEQQRRIAEVPEIHADPKMCPSFESEEEEEDDNEAVPKRGKNSKKAICVRPSYSGYPQNGRNSSSPNKKGKKEPRIHSRSRTREKIDVNGAHSSVKPMNQVNSTNSKVGGKNDQAVQRTGLETPTTTATVENSPSANNIETEKLWHYRDPNGKIQGPFSVMQLRKWNTTGLFPPDMRIWTNHEQYDSLLLTDALIGHLHGVSESSFKQSSVSRENGTAGGIGESEATNGTSRCSKQTEAACSNNVTAVSNSISGFVKENASHSSCSQCDLPNDRNSIADNAQERKHGRADGPLLVQGQQSDELNHGVQNAQDKHGRADGPLLVQGQQSDELNHGAQNAQELKHGRADDPLLVQGQQSDELNHGAQNTQEHKHGRADGPLLVQGQQSDELNHGAQNAQECKHGRADGPLLVQVQQSDELNRGAQNAQECKSGQADGPLLVQDQQSDELTCGAQTAQERNCGRADVPLLVQSDELNHGAQNVEKNSSGPTPVQVSSGNKLDNQSNIENRATQPNEENLRSLNIDLSSNLLGSESAVAPVRTMQPNEENLRSLNIDLSSNLMESESVVPPVSKSPDLNKQVGNIDLSDLHSPTPTDAEKQPSVSGILELLSPTPRLNNEDATEAGQSGIQNFPVPDSGPRWSVASSLVAGGVELPDVANDWCGYSPTPIKPSIPDWDSSLASVSSLKPEITNEYTATSISDGHQLSQAPPPVPASNTSNWRELLNEPIVFDALGEELISDLFAEVDARESQGPMHSPTSAIKLVREFLEDDCFSSIEDFNPTPYHQRCDASCSTGEMQMTSQSSCNPVETFDAFDSFRKSSVNSSASSEGETNAQVYSGDAGSEFHPPEPNINPSQDMVGHATTATSCGSADPMDPSWGTVQGNINLVTVQGNVNLVLGGPQGMANLGWGNNPGAAWVNPSLNHSPRNMSLPWDSGQQRKYGGERYTSPRAGGYQGSELGFGRGRPPRGRQAYNGGGFSRPLPKGQRVCKFYENGHCKKGAFCDYLHPS